MSFQKAIDEAFDVNMPKIGEAVYKFIHDEEPPQRASFIGVHVVMPRDSNFVDLKRQSDSKSIRIELPPRDDEDAWDEVDNTIALFVVDKDMSKFGMEYIDWAHGAV